jgi:hypothetical protein
VPSYIVHVGYFLMLCGFLARDVLHLRGLLILAQAAVGTYAWLSGVPAIAAWNFTFVCINSFMAAWIIHDRRSVELPEELRALYDRHFSALGPAEFLKWWKQGKRERLVNQPLARVGQRPDWLYFLMNGIARVSRDRVAIVDLQAGFFLAEMSLLTGKPANADVDAVGEIEVVRWATRDLHDLRQRNPVLWTKIQSVIGHDLVEKIQLGESRARAVLGT